nr:kinesin-like protein KIN-12F [Ipomoea batatas]
MRRMYFNQLGWIPLVKDALAGYNTSLLAYGQEHENYEDKQISYQCRCSFLEVYNGHIGDLLDPMQRNLKDDTKNGFYVENLTEEYVSTYEDVTQILIKLLEWNGNRDCEQEIVKEIQGEVDHDDRGKCFDMAERDALLTEIENLKSKLQQYTDGDGVET